jgi:hypothetical protein
MCHAVSVGCGAARYVWCVVCAQNSECTTHAAAAADINIAMCDVRQLHGYAYRQAQSSELMIYL